MILKSFDLKLIFKHLAEIIYDCEIIDFCKIEFTLDFKIDLIFINTFWIDFKYKLLLKSMNDFDFKIKINNFFCLGGGRPLK